MCLLCELSDRYDVFYETLSQLSTAIKFGYIYDFVTYTDRYGCDCSVQKDQSDDILH